MGRTNRHADRHQDTHTHTLTHGEVIVVVATSATHMWARTCSLMLSHGQVCDQQLYSLSTKLTTKSQSILPMHYNKSQQVSQLSASTTKRHEHTFCNHLDIETFRGVRAPQPGIEWTSNGKHRSLHTQTLLHNNVFHTDTFTHRRLTQKGFYTQKLAHTEAFTHRSFYIHRILHTETFTHTHTHFDTQSYTQKLSHTEAFTDRSFRTQKLLHTNTFTHRDRTHDIAILLNFWRSNLISCKRVAPGHEKSQFYLHVWRSNLISNERVCRTLCKSQFYRSFWRSNLISCERVAIGRQNSQFYLSFWRSNLISCERVAILPQLLAIEPHFVRKGCISWRRAFKREIEKKEGARGQERMWRCEDEKIWRCTDVEMWGCEDEKMGRYVKMRRCEDEKMWRWEDVSQTPTIRRTLRSDALGKKTSQICPNGIFDIFPWHFPWILSRGMFHRFSESMENAVENVGIFRFSQCWVFHSFSSISWNFR